jgi:hypothetical protein
MKDNKKNPASMIDSYKYLKNLCEVISDPAVACRFVIDECESRISELDHDDKTPDLQSMEHNVSKIKEYIDDLNIQINKEKYQKEFLATLLKEIVGDDWDKMTIEKAETLTVVPTKDLIIDIAMRDGYAYEIVEETEHDVAIIAHFQNEDRSDHELKLWWDKKQCTIFRKCTVQRNHFLRNISLLKIPCKENIQ